MSGHGGRHFSTAMFGVAITAVFVSYQLLTDSQSPIPRDSVFMILLVVLCPPSLLSTAFEPEVGSNSFYLLWTVIAVMNAALYATIRALLSRRLQRPD
jgi:hypothetical protein